MNLWSLLGKSEGDCNLPRSEASNRAACEELEVYEVPGH